MPDYLPRTDSEFDRWFKKFLEYCLANTGALGMARHEIDELQTALVGWGAAFARQREAQAAARTATLLKKERRIAGERVIRKYVRIIQARPATTDEQRRGLGISLKPAMPPREDVLMPVSPPGGEPHYVGY